MPHFIKIQGCKILFWVIVRVLGAFRVGFDTTSAIKMTFSHEFSFKNFAYRNFYINLSVFLIDAPASKNFNNIDCFILKPLHLFLSIKIYIIYIYIYSVHSFQNLISR